MVVNKTPNNIQVMKFDSVRIDVPAEPELRAKKPKKIIKNGIIVRNGKIITLLNS